MRRVLSDGYRITWGNSSTTVYKYAWRFGPNPSPKGPKRHSLFSYIPWYWNFSCVILLQCHNRSINLFDLQNGTRARITMQAAVISVFVCPLPVSNADVPVPWYCRHQGWNHALILQVCMHASTCFAIVLHSTIIILMIKMIKWLWLEWW